MHLSTIDPLGQRPIAERYDTYRTERPQTQAPQRTGRLAGAQSPQFARIPAHAQSEVVVRAPRQAVPATAGDTGTSVERLRDLYVTHRLASAVQAFHDEQALQERARAANDLGTIQGLLPLQPYRFAAANPPIPPQQLAAAASLAPAAVGPVANLAALGSATDHALGAGPGARARVRNPREFDA